MRIFVFLLLALTAFSANAQTEFDAAKKRVHDACALGRDACLQAINREKTCSEYRGDAVTVYNSKLEKIPPKFVFDNITKPRAPAFANEPIYTPLVSDDDVARLIRMAYSGNWATPTDFASEALRRCVANYKLN